MFSGIEAVVVVGQPDLRDIEPAVGAPLSDIDPHIHGSEEPLHPTCCLSLKAIGEGGKEIPSGILEIGHSRLASFLLAKGDHRLQALRFRGNHLQDDLFLLHPGADRTDLQNLAQNMKPVLALAGHLFLVFPKDVLQLMGNMPETALEKERDLSLQSVQDRGVPVGQQKEVLERLESLQAGPEQLPPTSVVGADIHPGHPDASAFPVLDEHLQLLALLLDPGDPDSRPIRFLSGPFRRVQGEGDLLGRLLNRLPDRHLVERPHPKVETIFAVTR